MGRLILEAEARDGTGKGIVRKLRREGFIPAVLYGLKQKPESLKVKEEDFEEVKRGGAEHAVIEIKVGESAKTPAVVKEEQFDRVSGGLLHVDFCRVSLTEKLKFFVPVVTTGESAGVKVGGVLEHILREIEVECLPDKMPENIEIDVTDLEIGDSVHIRDIDSPEGVEIVTDGSRGVISVMAPRVVEEEEVAEEAVEPELVGGDEEAEEPAEEEGKKEQSEGEEKGKGKRMK